MPNLFTGMYMQNNQNYISRKGNNPLGFDINQLDQTIQGKVYED